MSGGRVILVGAGPGDPDLITVRGVAALRVADVVLYDSLSTRELLGLAPEYAEWIDEILAAEPALENRRGAGWSSEVEDRPCTAYEAEWRAERRALHFFTYSRRPDVAAPRL